LSNFEVLNGDAEYTIENGCIVGVSHKNTPNTFLATKEIYKNFILEFEVWADPLLNSGVQIRSVTDSTINNGRVYGHQIEIESSDRKWAGGIYDEGRRGWLYPLKDNAESQNAFKVNEWNKYRIEANGNHLKTWVNGIMCANLKDSISHPGFIALQVHSISDSLLENKIIKWRNLMIITDDISQYSLEGDSNNVPLINLEKLPE
jgi:hypothetical protein